MTFSQVGQDLFVINKLNQKRNGYYIEIGGHDPVLINNTYLLEQQYNWTGFSLEIQSSLVDRYNLIRKNKCILSDATKFDFKKFLNENNYPKQIDYLSLDIEPPEQTYICLCNMPLSEYRFSVITFEHDSYYAGNKYRDLSRELLTNLGYILTVPDVKCNNDPFEDWYVDKNI